MTKLNNSSPKTKPMTSDSEEVKGLIAKKEHAIYMLGCDAWGNNAYDNSRRMDELRKEIENLKKYGKAKPNWLNRLFGTGEWKTGFEK